ncbi:MAG TPA: hypothetical protein VK897_22610 [Anaerolineales bacterium]|nr:hypothetical protein [Anaerolineales bacterium]
MKQYEAVIIALEKLGGQATLADLYRETMKVEGAKWETKTPFASIRRIVQQRPEIFKVRPGLWALKSYQKKLGLVENADKDKSQVEQNHAYYQGILLSIGNLRGYKTFSPNQDKNKLFVNNPLKQIRGLQDIPRFSYDGIVQRCSTVDVIWFNSRLLPNSLFEVEHSTDFQNSLIKFSDLQDFYTRMIIVADDNRKREFSQKMQSSVFNEVASRVNFLGYESLVKQYEMELLKSSQVFAI